MTDSACERDPVELLADEFASRYRNGECPSVAEYAARYPRYAGKIAELFPAVAMMEQLRTEEKAKRDAAAARARFANPPEHIGDFDIVQEIGRGGMGIVYEAEQRSLARRVAVKVLPKHILLLDRHLKRFQREAQTAAKLRHTNIVPIFGVGDQDGLHYYVMPLIQGIGLDEMIRELRGADTSDRDINRVVRTRIANKFTTAQSDRARPSLPANHWRMVAHIGIQAAEALHYAHTQGTLHRDIKPGNLLVDGDGVVCVADFGLARAVDRSDMSHTSEVVGTLRYMAPEQLRGAADARSDVYALGLTLYELLILQAAFDDTDRRRCHNGQQVRLEPVQPRKINRAVPRDLETVILKCLAHEPSKRYETAGALATDLRRFLRDKPIRARRTSWAERAWRWCRRNPALAAVSALAAMLLIVVAATAVTGYIETRRAYAEATDALASAKATSQLAMEALDDIYLQLSPDRVLISSDPEPGGADGAERSRDRTPMQVQASNETALLLENLLVFYDRLAEQIPSDFQLTLESAIASRRVGDIRQRLGQADQAEREYERAVEKFKTLVTRPDANVTALIELAQTHNEIGNVRSARLEYRRAYESHVKAFSILQSNDETNGSAAEYQYELARTFYFLAGKRLSGLGNRRGVDAGENVAGSRPHHYRSTEYPESAIGILDELARENPDAPDYRFLLALCHRLSSIGHAWGRSSTGAEGRQRSIRVLEELKAQYPHVADYRYELAATYASVHVGLYPWEERPVPTEAERNLLRGLDESQWLVTHNPTIPEYARSHALILAKLGVVCWRTQRLENAEEFLEKALDTHSALITAFPDLPSHNQIFLEFIRLRLGQVCFERNIDSQDPNTLNKSRDLLETCIGNLTELMERPELVENRLAWSSLPVAYDALSQVLTEIGENDKAEQAKKNAEAVRSKIPDKRRHLWRQ